MTNRRSFLIGIGSALAAPAIVRADSLMKLWVPKPNITPAGFVPWGQETDWAVDMSGAADITDIWLVHQYRPIADLLDDIDRLKSRISTEFFA